MCEIGRSEFNADRSIMFIDKSFFGVVEEKATFPDIGVSDDNEFEQVVV
jgi:hypothetical protein